MVVHGGFSRCVIVGGLRNLHGSSFVCPAFASRGSGLSSEGSPPSPLPALSLSLPGRLSRVAGKRIHTTCTSHPDFSDSPSQFEFVVLSRCLNAWSSCGSSSLCVTRQHAQERARAHSRAFRAVTWLHLDASDENVFGSHCTKPDTLEASIVLEATTVSTGAIKEDSGGPTEKVLGRVPLQRRQLHVWAGPTEVVGELSQHSSFRLTRLKTDLFFGTPRVSFFFLRFSQQILSTL